MAAASACRQAAHSTIAFPGGGVYFYWQAGCGVYLRERYNLSAVKVAGSSAGALTAALLANDVDFVRATEKAIEVAHEADLWNRPLGLAGVWGRLVRQWLDDLLPEDAHTRSHGRFAADMCTLPWLATQFVDEHPTRLNVIDTCMASVHVPFFMDGRLAMNFKGQYVVDGSLWRCIVGGNRSFDKHHCPTHTLCLDHHNDMKLQAEVKHHFLDMLSEKMAWQLMDFGYQYAREADKQRPFSEMLHCEPLDQPVSQHQRILDKLEACIQSETSELF